PAGAATLILEGGTSITDGTLVNGDVGTVEIHGTTGATFDNVDVNNAGLLQVDGASRLLLVGGATITGGDITVASGGLLKTYGAGIEINAVVTNDGTIEINNGGTLKISTSISGTGSVRIDGGATFELNGSDSQTVEFNGDNAVFRIDGSSFGGSIAGFAVSDEIDLKAFGYDDTTTATFEKGVLTLFHGGESISMTLVGDYSHAHLAGSGDGTHTLITFKAEDDAPVFAEDSENGSIDERPNTTGSPALDSVGGTLHFGDIDLLDRPTASVTSKSVTWIAANHTDLGTPSQLAAIENALTLTHSGANNGAIGWTYSIADGVLDFLAEGETLTFTATVTLTDGEKSDTAQVVVTIKGHNDAPVITVNDPAAVTEGNTGTSAPVTVAVAGHVAITDVDASDVHTPYVANTLAFDTAHSSGPGPSSGTLAGLFTIDPVSGTISYDKAAFDYLAAGEHVVAKFTFDASSGPDNVPQTITITIDGANDAPIVASALSDSAHEGDASFSRNLLTGASDVDHGETATLSVANLSYSVNGGTASSSTPGVSLDPDGYTLKINPSDPAFEYLGVGKHTTITVSYDVKDAHGATVHQTETITITGTNDAPSIVAETDAPAEAVMVVPATASVAVLAPGVTTNSLGLNTETFNDRSLGHDSFHSTALNADFHASGSAGIVHGSTDGVTAAPFFGPLPGAPDTTNYLTVGGGGVETITFASEQNAFGLYWGSVDSYNSISFYDGSTLVGSYTGASVAPLFADGNQGSFASNGYVQFSGLAEFNKVVLQSSSNAFEIDNISSGAIHSKLSASVSGTLSVHDADIGDTLTGFVIGNGTVQFTGANGSHQLPNGANVAALIDAQDVTFDSVQSDGGTDVLHWTYHPTNPDLDFLKAGDVLKIQFAAEVSDGHGHTESQPLTVTLVGANSATDTSAFGVVNGTTAGDTFNHVGGNVTIFGNGGPDTFVFKPGFGSATIADFDANNDTIEISKDLFTTFADVIAHAHPVNSNLDLAITDAASETITLKGVTASQLHASNFHLV
ncbi:MAG: VCBS domain-containing protein, partial [Xanthobacteraceae bacterium]|nr:VCBS domain-containing protein [Xanthobacteraceae bacterium]